MTDVAKLGLEIETKGADEATRKLNDLDKAAQQAANSADQLSGSAQQTSAALGEVGNAADQSAGFFGTIGQEVLKAEVAIELAERALTALYETIKAGIRAYAEYEVATVQLTQSFERVGNQTGFTISQLQEYAGQLESVSGVAEESILKIAQVLNRTGKSSGEDFKRLMQLSLDLASAMGGDPVNAAEQLARALQDPGRAVSMLRRQFADFDPVIADAIERMAEAGDKAGATALLFDELESSIGGSAAAATDTLSGAWARLQDALGDAARELVTATKAGAALTEVLNILAQTLQAVAKLMTDAGEATGEFAKLLGASDAAAQAAVDAYDTVIDAVNKVKMAYYLATGQGWAFIGMLTQSTQASREEREERERGKQATEQIGTAIKNFSTGVRDALQYAQRLGKVVLENADAEKRSADMLKLSARERSIAEAGTNAYAAAKARLTAETGRFGAVEEGIARKMQASAEAAARAAQAHDRAGGGASRHARSLRDLEDPLSKTVDDLNEYIRSLEREAELAGMSGQARDIRIAQMRIEDTITRNLGDSNEDLAKAYGERAAAAIKAADEARAAAQREQDAIRAVEDAQRDAISAFTDFATSVINGSEDAGEALGNLLIKLVEIYFQMQLMQSMGGGGGGFDLFGIIGGILGFGGGASVGGGSIPVGPVSRGGVFDEGAMVPFSRGGMVERPTMRSMALMGEAGPEAVLPLRRDGAGNLGVGTSGGNGQVKVVVQNIDQRKSGSTETKSEQGPDGTTFIRTFIRDEVKRSIADGSMDRDMTRNYGLQRNPTRR